MIGTVHERDFGEGTKWYFVPALVCDILLGHGVPNDNYINENKYNIINPNEFLLLENNVWKAQVSTLSKTSKLIEKTNGKSF